MRIAQTHYGTVLFSEIVPVYLTILVKDHGYASSSIKERLTRDTPADSKPTRASFILVR